MQNLEGNGRPVLYIGRTFLKVKEWKAKKFAFWNRVVASKTLKIFSRL
jgi:hypothetical protein